MARDYEVLIEEATGTRSRANLIAAVALPAATIGYHTNGGPPLPGKTYGTVALLGADNAATVMVAGHSLELTAGAGPAVIFDFYDGHAGAYAGANHGIDVQTTVPVTIDDVVDAIQTAWRANGGADAVAAAISISSGHLFVTTADDAKALRVEGDVATLAALGIEDGVYEPVAGKDQGIVPWDAAGDANTICVVPAKTRAQQAFVGYVREAEVKDAILLWPADDDQKAAAATALAAKGIIVR